MPRKIGQLVGKYNAQKIIAFTALMVILSLSDGGGGAKIISSLIKAACKKNKQKEYHDGYYRTVLDRLKRDGLVTSPKRGIWMLTPKGRDAACGTGAMRLPKPRVPREEADVFVIFDIPEIDRKKRAGVRYELFMRGFFPFQKSVWLGKGPLDKDFMDFLKITRLLRYVHIFSIAKRGTI